MTAVSSTACRDGPGRALSGAGVRHMGQFNERRRQASLQFEQKLWPQLAGHAFASVSSSMHTGHESSVNCGMGTECASSA